MKEKDRRATSTQTGLPGRRGGRSDDLEQMGRPIRLQEGRKHPRYKDRQPNRATVGGFHCSVGLEGLNDETTGADGRSWKATVV